MDVVCSGPSDAHVGLAVGSVLHVWLLFGYGEGVAGWTRWWLRVCVSQL